MIAMRTHLRRSYQSAKRPLAVIVAASVGLAIGIVLGTTVSSGSSSGKAVPTAVLVATRVTNEIQLDNGTCGRNLQLGNDRTASSSATPTFLLNGDGGASEYTAKIDGQALPGSFTSDGYGNVCITVSTGLSDGPHILAAREIRPNPQDVTPFAFSGDT